MSCAYKGLLKVMEPKLLYVELFIVPRVAHNVFLSLIPEISMIRMNHRTKSSW
jgi:hypothetical protein